MVSKRFLCFGTKYDDVHHSMIMVDRVSVFALAWFLIWFAIVGCLLEVVEASWIPYKSYSIFVVQETNLGDNLDSWMYCWCKIFLNEPNGNTCSGDITLPPSPINSVYIRSLGGLLHCYK